MGYIGNEYNDEDIIETFDNTNITDTLWFSYSSLTPINIALVILIMILIYNITIQCFDI